MVLNAPSRISLTASGRSGMMPGLAAAGANGDPYCWPYAGGGGP
jgi:hypothetical protein